MKSFITMAALAIVSTAALAQDKGFEKPYLVKPLSGTSFDRVEASTAGGNLSLAGEGDPRVEVYVSGGHRLSEAEKKERVEKYWDIEIGVSDGKLTATARPKTHGPDNGRVGISFRIFTPHNVASNLRTSGGNIAIAHVAGNQEFTTSGGNLSVNEVEGGIKGRTSGGNIALSHSHSPANIDLGTSGGNISAEDCAATSITLGTSGGNLELRTLEGEVRANTSGGNVSASEIKGSIDAHTSGGQIHLDNLHGSVKASTSGGNVDVDVVSLGKFVRIDNSGGNISIKLPKGQGMDLSVKGDRISTGELAGFDGKMEKNRIQGKLAGGGIPVDIDNSGGQVSIALK